MVTNSSAFSMCYHLLVIFLLICTILDVAASVDEDDYEDGEDDLQEAIPPPQKQEIINAKRLVDVYRYWACMQTAMEKANASGGDTELDAQLMTAEEALDEYVKLIRDGSASQANKDMAFRVLKEKVEPIEEQFEPPSDCQKLVKVGELFVEILVKLDSGVLQMNSEIDRQLETALTKCTTLMRISYKRELTSQEMEETAQMKKNLEKILGKSAGRLRGCLYLTLGATLLSTFLSLVGRRVFPDKWLDLLTNSTSSSISEDIEYSNDSGPTGQAMLDLMKSHSSSIVVLLATVGLVIIGLLLYYFSDRIWSNKATKKRRTTEKCSQVKTGESSQTVGGKFSQTKCRESNSV